MKSSFKNALQGAAGNAVFHALGLGPSAALANLGGVVVGLANDNDPADDAATSFVPGVAAARDVMHRKKISRDLTKGKVNNANAVSENLGILTGSVLPSLCGGALGAYIGAKSNDSSVIGASLGLLMGAGAGLALPNAGAALAALFTKTRSEDEQAAYENASGTRLKNYLLPGASLYNHLKSRGYMFWGDQKGAIKKSAAARPPRPPAAPVVAPAAEAAAKIGKGKVIGLLATGAAVGAGSTVGGHYVFGTSRGSNDTAFGALDALAVLAGGYGGYRLADRLAGKSLGTGGKVGIGIGAGLLSGIASQQLRQAIKK